MDTKVLVWSLIILAIIVFVILVSLRYPLSNTGINENNKVKEDFEEKQLFNNGGVPTIIGMSIMPQNASEIFVINMKQPAESMPLPSLFINPFEGNIADLSGNGHQVKLEGDARYENGKIILEGNEPYISTNYVPNFDNNTNYSFAIWFKDDNAGITRSTNTALISNYGAIYTKEATTLHVRNDGRISIRERNSDLVSHLVSTDKSYTDGKWHFIVKVATDDEQKLYIDGEEVGSTARPGGKISNNVPIVIGGNTLMRYQTCELGPIQIYEGHALNKDEVFYLWTKGSELKSVIEKQVQILRLNNMNITPDLIINPFSIDRLTDNQMIQYTGPNEKIVNIELMGNTTLDPKQGFVLSENDSYISTDLNPNLDDVEYTFAIWFKDNNSGLSKNTYTALISNYGSKETKSFAGLHIENNGRIRIGERNDSNEESSFVTDDSYTDGSWHHIVKVSTRTTQYLYVDSELKGSIKRINGKITSGHPIVIGGNTLNTYQTCNIGPVYIFLGRAFEAEEVKAIRNIDHFFLKQLEIENIKETQKALERDKISTFVAKGGNNVYEYEDYTVHVYNIPGETTFEANEDGEVDVFVVAGGGSGGNQDSFRSAGAGGGGAGGLVLKQNLKVKKGSTRVYIGKGGDAPMKNNPGIKGEDSMFGPIKALGGGGGGTRDKAPTSGGSGGGARTENVKQDGGMGLQPKEALWGLGNMGGNGIGGNGNDQGGGGGGGAMKRGSPNNGWKGGNGGDGVNMGYMFGTKVGMNGLFGGGGGGGSGRSGYYSKGGIGGGGDGTHSRSGWAGNGIDGTGGGGGGGASGDASPGKGGNGVIVVRYKTPRSSESIDAPLISGRTNNEYIKNERKTLYSHFLWNIKQTRGGNGLQAAGFQLMINGEWVNPVAVKDVGNYGYGRGGSEKPENMLDGVLGGGLKKMYTHTSNTWAGIFSLSQPQEIQGYRWGTANDVPIRDPIYWTLEAAQSEEGPFDLIDVRAIHNTFSRNTWLPFMPVRFDKKNDLKRYIENAEADGGDEVKDINGYRIHIFRTPGEHTMRFDTASKIELLTVGGGGGGGAAKGKYLPGGGGGGGEVVHIKDYKIAQGDVKIKVGNGGDASLYGKNQGGMSVFHDVRANGGGGGGRGGDYGYDHKYMIGGSGGGGGRCCQGNTWHPSGISLKLHSSGLGNNGGHVGGMPNSSVHGYRGWSNGGGGGGATRDANFHHGGEGYSTDITGTSEVYGSGGGGGQRSTQSRAGTNGGIGGGRGDIPASGSPGVPGTGSGGGGGAGNGRDSGQGGNGGHGIVVIKYPLEIDYLPKRREYADTFDGLQAERSLAVGLHTQNADEQMMIDDKHTNYEQTLREQRERQQRLFMIINIYKSGTRGKIYIDGADHQPLDTVSVTKYIEGKHFIVIGENNTDLRKYYSLDRNNRLQNLVNVSYNDQPWKYYVVLVPNSDVTFDYDVVVPIDGKYRLKVRINTNGSGTNDSFNLVVNGKNRYVWHTGRPTQWNWRSVDVDLIKGKNTIGLNVREPTAFSALRVESITKLGGEWKEKKDHMWNDYKSYKTDTAEKCAWECKQDPKCKVMSYSTYGDEKACWLKNNYNASNEIPHMYRKLWIK